MKARVLFLLLLSLVGPPLALSQSPPPFNVSIVSLSSTISSVTISPPLLPDFNRTFTYSISQSWNRTLDRLVGGAPTVPQGWTAAYFTNNGTTPLAAVPTTDAGWAQVDRVVASGSYRNFGPVPDSEDLQVRERGGRRRSAAAAAVPPPCSSRERHPPQASPTCIPFT
jgi:hypothetical protein